MAGGAQLPVRTAAAAGAVSHCLGCVAGAYLWRRRAAVAVALQGLGHACVVWLAPLVVWLMGAPAGLKLHEELSGLLGGAGLWLLHSTHAMYGRAAPTWLPHLLGD